TEQPLTTQPTTRAMTATTRPRPSAGGRYDVSPRLSLPVSLRLAQWRALSLFAAVEAAAASNDSASLGCVMTHTRPLPLEVVTERLSGADRACLGTLARLRIASA